MSRKRSTNKLGNAVFLAQESFLVEEELKGLKEKLGENASMNWSIFNTEEGPSMDEIINLCNTMPFLSERRVIIIRNCQKLNAKQIDQITAYLGNANESTTLILVMEVERTDKDQLKVIKKLEAKVEVVHFDTIKNRASRISWIIERSLLHGKVIDKDAAALLADMTASSSMWYMDSEISKLCLYAARESSISIKDVHESVMRTPEPAIFAFLDALFDRKKDALPRLYELELAGIADLELISRIENQIINHYVVLSGKDWKKMKIHDFIAEKALRRKPLWSLSQLASMLKDLRQIEQGIKSSSLVHVYAALTEVIGRHVLSIKNDGRI